MIAFQWSTKMELDRIVNCVCYFSLVRRDDDGETVETKLNLPELYEAGRREWRMSYNPQQFGSANIRMPCPELKLEHFLALVFSTGRTVCPGMKSREAGIVAADHLARELSRVLGTTLVVRDFSTPNLVGTIRTRPIDLRWMAESLGEAKARYITEGRQAFPACFVFPHKDAIAPDSVAYTVFATGKVVIMGCRSEYDIAENQREARELCERFPAGPPRLE